MIVISDVYSESNVLSTEDWPYKGHRKNILCYLRCVFGV